MKIKHIIFGVLVAIAIVILATFARDRLANKRVAEGLAHAEFVWNMQTVRSIARIERRDAEGKVYYGILLRHNVKFAERKVLLYNTRKERDDVFGHMEAQIYEKR